MIRKIVHISDLHIRNYKMHDQYKEVFNFFIRDIKKLRKEYSYEEMRIVIVGDLFHQKITVSNEQFILAYTFLKACTKYCPVIIIAGNHDLLENNKERMDSISPIIEVIKNNNISYYKNTGCYLDDNVVWCVYSVFDSNMPPDIITARKEHGNKLYVGLFHGPVIGSKTDTNYEMEHGVNLTYFDGCDVVMLGDIHKIQKFELIQTKKRIPIVYSGSMIQQNYGESITNHGYLLWDVESKTYEEHNLESSYGFYKFEIKSLEDIENGEEKLINK